MTDVSPRSLGSNPLTGSKLSMVTPTVLEPLVLGPSKSRLGFTLNDSHRMSRAMESLLTSKGALVEYRRQHPDTGVQCNPGDRQVWSGCKPSGDPRNLSYLLCCISQHSQDDPLEIHSVRGESQILILKNGDDSTMGRVLILHVSN